MSHPTKELGCSFIFGGFGFWFCCGFSVRLFVFLPYVLVCLGCSNETVDWMAYKQQKCIAHSLEGKVQDQGVSMSAGPLLTLRLLIVSLHGRRGEGSLWSLFC